MTTRLQGFLNWAGALPLELAESIRVQLDKMNESDHDRAAIDEEVEDWEMTFTAEDGIEIDFVFYPEDDDEDEG